MLAPESEQLTKNARLRVRRGNVADVEAIKVALIKAAENLFLERGLDRVTMRSVAERAGVASMTPYTYFKNKSDILWHLKNNVLGELADNQFACIEGETNPRQALRKSMTHFYHFWLDRPEKYRLMYLTPDSGDENISFKHSGSAEVHRLRTLQEKLSDNFADYLGGYGGRSEATGQYRYAVTQGYLHLCFLKLGVDIKLAQSVDEVVDLMIDSVEILLKKPPFKKPDTLSN